MGWVGEMIYDDCMPHEGLWAGSLLYVMPGQTKTWCLEEDDGQYTRALLRLPMPACLTRCDVTILSKVLSIWKEERSLGVSLMKQSQTMQV